MGMQQWEIGEIRMHELEAEVGRLREGQRTDSNSIVRLTTRIAEYQDRVAELERIVGYIEESGHNDDCLFCARKDTLARRALKAAHPDADEEKGS